MQKLVSNEQDDTIIDIIENPNATKENKRWKTMILFGI